MISPMRCNFGGPANQYIKRPKIITKSEMARVMDMLLLRW